MCGTILAVLFAVCPTWGATVVYVDSGATGAGDGTSWADAYTSVQPALDAAAAGDQVWVAAGTYVENITLKDAVALYGGLAGTEDPANFALADRDFTAHETILDGNQVGSVVTIPLDAIERTRIDGFTITNGIGTYRDRSTYGGGIYSYRSSAVVENNRIIGNRADIGGGIYLYSIAACEAMITANTITENVASSTGGGMFLSQVTVAGNTIKDNVAEYDGGGVFAYQSTFVDNTIAGNTAGSGGGISANTSIVIGNRIANNIAESWGGGIAFTRYYDVTGTINDNQITGNVAYEGGGIYCYSASMEICRNTIAGNSARHSGGAAYVSSSFLSTQISGNVVHNNSADFGGGFCLLGSFSMLDRCVFTGNRAAYSGGGVAGGGRDTPITNCIFSGNTAGSSGGGVYAGTAPSLIRNCVFSGNSAATGGGLYYNYSSSSSSPMTIANCIVWGNEAAIAPDLYQVTPFHCDVRGWEATEGNINCDPVFVRHPSPGSDGIWGTTDDDYGDLRLLADSPCIDAGKNAEVPAGVTVDLAGGPRFLDEAGIPDIGNGTPPIVDMGAYEGAAPVLSTPAFDPDSGPINASQQVTITCTTPGAIIHYTTDGRDPTEDDPTVESGESVSVSTESPTTLKAKAWKDGLEPSGVKTAVYWRPVIVFVTLDGDDANDGSSWATAKRTVQAGINAAQTGDWVWVAAGIYTPTGDGDRAKSFAMKPGVTLFGGFAGTEDPTVFTPTDRDLNANETILSGDLLGNDNGQVAHDEPTRQDNSFHVVVGADDATLDGFTITGGNASGAASAAQLGAGMYNNGCSPSVTGCLFRDNTAVLRGAGMYNCNNSPTVVRCSFTGNSAGDGGGMDNDDHAVPRVVGCLFSRNSATSIVASGGGMRNGQYSDATVMACSFVGNTGIKGGGMYNAENSQATVTHCVFHANRAVGSVAFGGGVVNRTKTEVRFRYCTFVGNVAGGDRGSGGALAVIQAAKDSTSVVNSIFWGNTAPYGSQLYRSTEASVAVSYCNIQGGCSGTGNIDADPQFASPWGNYRLRPGSPCIDAGTNTVGLPIGTRDFDGAPRIVDGDGDGTAIADMGAYEYAGLPTVVGAVSRKSHGAAGEFDLDLPLDGGLFAFGEGRLGGVSELVVAFSEPVFAADGVADESEVSVSVGVVQNVGLAGDQMTVQLSGVAETTCLAVAFAGLVDADGNPMLGPRFSFCVLAGDVNGDGTVDLLDLEQIRDQLNQPVTADSVRADVNTDGQVNIFDLVAVRNRLDATGPCP